MSIFFITGKPRGGKSFIAVKYAYEILMKAEGDKRPIMTNLPLKLDVVAAELKQDLRLDFTPDLTTRIRLLDDGQTGEFWLYSMENGEHKEFTGRKKIQMRSFSMNVPDFEKRGETGALYIVDECHVYFPSAFGSKIDNEEDLRFFLTQHGKMNIDIIFITQHPEQVSKVLRRLCQEYMNVRNMSREPYMGFRIGNLFRWVRSLNPPGSMNAAPFESGFIKMDFEKFGKMYDTTAGVGIVGAFVKTPPVRGRSLYWLCVPVIAFVCFAYWLAFVAPKEVTNLAKRVSQGGAPVAKTNSPPKSIIQSMSESAVATAVPPHPVVEQVTPRNSQATSVETEIVETNDVVVTGVFGTDGHYEIFLSDGRTAESEYGEVQQVFRSGVVCFHHAYKMQTTSQAAKKVIDNSLQSDKLLQDKRIVATPSRQLGIVPENVTPRNNGG